MPQCPALAALALLSGTVLTAQHFDAERHRLLPSGSALRAVAADFDGDGDQDLAMIVSGGLLVAAVEFAWNDGQGRFRRGAAQFAAFASSLAAGDIDGDGDIDLAVGQSWLGSYRQPLLLRNDGPAGFVNVAAQQWPATNEAPLRIVMLDFDRDGDVDLLTCNTSAIGAAHMGQPSPICRLYQNNGQGFFTDVTATRLPNAPERNTSVATGDLDGDGDPDLLLGTAGAFTASGACRVFLQSAQGVMAEAQGRVPAVAGFTGSYADVVLADFDLDGDLDLAAASTAGVHLFANNGQAMFTFVASLPDPRMTTLQVLDLDRDGRPDLLATREYAPERQPLPLLFFRNTPAGFVEATAAHVELPELAPRTVCLLDGDGDGDQDLWGACSPQPALWHGDGQGRLLQIGTRELSTSAVLFAAMADVDGDDDLDAAVIEGSPTGAQVAFARNPGGGPGAGRVTLVPFDPSRRPACLAFLDVDADGDLDLYVGNQPGGLPGPNGQDLLFHNTGSGFVDVTATRLPVDLSPTTRVVVGDLDRDGNPDVVTAGFFSRFYRCDGLGSLLDASSLLPVPASPVSGVALLDYDGDGDLDIAQSLASDYGYGTLRLLRNDLPGPFVDVTAGLLPQWNAYAVAAIDIDHDGRRDLLFGGAGLLLFRNTAAGFVDETALRVPATFTNWRALSVLDVDGDGQDDVWCSGQSGTPSLPLRNDLGVLRPFPAGLLDAAGWLPPFPAAGDFDGDGDHDLVVGAGSLRNRVRDLQDAVPPRLGAVAELVLHAWAGDGANAQWAVLMLGARAAAPIPLPGLGNLLLDPSTAFVHSAHGIAGAGGEAVVSYAVPAQPGLLGARLFAQTLFLHTPATATWRLGNGVDLSIRL